MRERKVLILALALSALLGLGNPASAGGVLYSAYDAEIKALESRLVIKTEALQAILEEVAQSDPRAKKVKPQELIDSRYLDKMDKSGFMDQL